MRLFTSVLGTILMLVEGLYSCVYIVCLTLRIRVPDVKNYTYMMSNDII